MSKASEELTFESAVERLEGIVEKLESGMVSLDEALELFEEGVRLSGLCHAKLEEIDKKIEILTRGENGRLEAKPFEGDPA